MTSERTTSSGHDKSIVRHAALILLTFSALGPLALLVVWSMSGQWFYPALLPQHWSLAGWGWLSSDSTRITAAIRQSLLLAVLNGVIGTAVSFPIGRGIWRLHGWRRHVAAAAVFVPVAAPPIALGIGIQYVLLTLGLGATTVGVLLAHLVPTTGYLSLYFLAVFTLYDARIEDEARTLGATPRQVLFSVVFPILRRQIAEAVAIGFLISWAQYALTLTVGGGVVHTLPLEVFAYMKSGAGNYAASAALVMILPPLIALAAARFAAGRTSVSPV